MEIEGKIIVVLPAREGVSARGTQWKSQDYVIETHEAYPKKCCFNVFGADKIQMFNIQSGEELRVSFDIDAREYQGNGSILCVLGKWSVLIRMQLLHK